MPKTPLPDKINLPAADARAAATAKRAAASTKAPPVIQGQSRTRKTDPEMIQADADRISTEADRIAEIKNPTHKLPYMKEPPAFVPPNPFAGDHPGFLPISLSWKGVSYPVAENRVMGLLQAIEDGLNPDGDRSVIQLLTAPGGPPLTRTARAYSNALAFAGCKVTLTEVYLSFQRAMAQGGVHTELTVVELTGGLLRLLFPDLDLTFKTDDDAPPDDDDAGDDDDDTKKKDTLSAE